MVSFSERLEQQDLLLLKQAVNKKYAKKNNFIISPSTKNIVLPI